MHPGSLPLKYYIVGDGQYKGDAHVLPQLLGPALVVEVVGREEVVRRVHRREHVRRLLLPLHVLILRRARVKCSMRWCDYVNPSIYCVLELQQILSHQRVSMPKVFSRSTSLPYESSRW